MCIMQTTTACFAKPEFSVVRQHEEFCWLHTALEENADYCGFIVSADWLLNQVDWRICLALACAAAPDSCCMHFGKKIV